MKYKAKTLFSGSVVGKDQNLNYVGVPGGQNYKSRENFKNEKNFIVEFQGEQMVIESWLKAEAYRKFPDKQGRGMYTLAYFRWVPIPRNVIINPGHAMAKALDNPENRKVWEKTRRLLHSK